MKALVCEMCGSQELVKEGGMYVCQNCKTKYDPEEAKKLLVEVSGSVQIDNSKKLENLYKLARRAKQENNETDAANYYAQIALEDPDSWEAQFYKVYYTAMKTNIAGISSAANSVKNAGISALKLIRDSNESGTQKKKYVHELIEKTSIFRILLTSSAEKHYNGIDPEIRDKYRTEYINRITAANDMVYSIGQNVDRLFGASYKDYILVCYHEVYDDFIKRGNYDTAKEVGASIDKYDPEFKGAENAEKAKQDAAKFSCGFSCGCTIAIIIIGILIWWFFFH